MLLFKFDPYAAFIEVVDDPPELSKSGVPSISAFGFDADTMRSGAPTRMLVVQSVPTGDGAASGELH